MRLFGLGPSHQEARKPQEAALFANKIQCAGCIVQSGNGQLGKQAQFQHDSPDFERLPVLAWPVSACERWGGIASDAANDSDSEENRIACSVKLGSSFYNIVQIAR